MKYPKQGPYKASHPGEDSIQTGILLGLAAAGPILTRDTFSIANKQPTSEDMPARWHEDELIVQEYIKKQAKKGR